MKRKFKVNTVGGTHIMRQENVDFLRDKVVSLDNLQIFHYERPLLNMGGMRDDSKPYSINCYADGEIPEGMQERVSKFSKEQQELMAGYFNKLSGTINFAGTKIYLTHKNQVDQLEAISKRIAAIKTDEQYLDELQTMMRSERLDKHFLTYSHICADILDQLAEGVEGEIVPDEEYSGRD